LKAVGKRPYNGMHKDDVVIMKPSYSVVLQRDACFRRHDGKGGSAWRKGMDSGHR